ncbi:hypothetical protein FACS1894120_3790 [Clostridia bacterium]|nr:hypothetical protein FACS1894120_3790 [Clostridia bacterium]
MWYLCWLTLVCGYPNNKLAALLDEVGGAENLYNAVMKDSRFFSHMSDNLKMWAHFADCDGGRVGSDWADRFIARARSISPDKVNAVIKYCETNNIHIIPQGDKYYPEPLINIEVPPLLLFVQGNKEALSMPYMLNVVGSRKSSQYAKTVTRRICGELADPALTMFKFVIVSGMAKGADSAAHRGALDSKGMTVGVLACGISVDYPFGSFPVRNEIIANGGAIVTELAPATRPDKYYFAARNRIMSGLCGGTFLTEFPNKSGCHLTAAHAIDQCRDIYYLPPRDIYDPDCAGVIMYARDGAVPVMSAKDIAAGFGIINLSEEVRLLLDGKVKRISYASKAGQNEQESFRPEFSKIPRRTEENDSPQTKAAKKSNDISEKMRHEKETESAGKEAGTEPKQVQIPDDMEPGASGRKREILDILKKGDATTDVFLLEHNFDIGTLSMDLFDLEISGLVSQLPGNKYRLGVI